MKAKYYITLLLFLAVTLLYGQQKLVPDSYKIVDEIHGDLDQDGIDEKVVAYNMTPVEIENDGINRELILFKKDPSDNWIIWQRSLNAIGNSSAGGMMGDPYEGIEIKNGILLISENGGSSWKWRHTDKYRFQSNAFELIGYSSHYGKICEYWAEFDYNTVTGKILFKKEFEKCEHDDDQKIYKVQKESFNHKLKDKILLQNRNEKEIKITSPKYKEDLYL